MAAVRASRTSSHLGRYHPAGIPLLRSTNKRSWCGAIVWCHENCGAKCVALVGCFAFTLLSSSSQTSLMGFKSGVLLQNAVVALLVQGASHSVQVADSGSSITTPDHHASSSMFDSWNHTLRNRPFAYSRRTKTLRDEPKISNYDSSVHKTFQFSVVHWQCFMAQTSLFLLFCHLSNGFLTATRPVKPAAQSSLHS